MIKFEIVEDLLPNVKTRVSYRLLFNGEKHKGSREGNVVHYIFEKAGTVEIYKDNLWSKTDKSNTIGNMILFLDIQNASTYDHINLPYSISYKNDLIDNTEYKIYLNDIAEVPTKLCISNWKKATLLQSIIISTLVLIMGVLLSFVFGSILQYIFVFIITALTILLFIKFKKRSELIKDNLIKLIKDNNFKE